MLSPKPKKEVEIERMAFEKKESGFSNFGHFKPPIKRPSCNPIVKDERFKRMNEGQSFHPFNQELTFQKPSHNYSLQDYNAYENLRNAGIDY